MSADIVVAIIQILPSMLAVLGLVILVIAFRKPLAQRILPRLSGVKVFGLEITLLKESLDEVTSGREVRVSEGDKWSALERAQHVLPVIQGARILWVDDQPQGSRQLVGILLSLGATVDQARNTQEALTMLRRHQYDVVVSDIRRSEGSDAGLRMVARMWEEGIYRWTIFYVLDLRPGVPEHAFNITNRPDHLLHYIMDVLERERWGHSAA